MDTKAIRARCEAAITHPCDVDVYMVHAIDPLIKTDIPKLLDEVERLTRVSDEYDRCRVDCGSLENIVLHKRIAELEAAVRGIIAGLNSQRGYYPKTVALLEKAIKGNAIKENKP